MDDTPDYAEQVWAEYVLKGAIGNLGDDDGNDNVVRFKFWYMISLPSSAKQQREMNKFKVL